MKYVEELKEKISKRSKVYEGATSSESANLNVIGGIMEDACESKLHCYHCKEQFKFNAKDLANISIKEKVTKDKTVYYKEVTCKYCNKIINVEVKGKKEIQEIIKNYVELPVEVEQNE